MLSEASIRAKIPLAGLLALFLAAGCQPADRGAMQETTVDTAAVLSAVDSLRQAFIDAYEATDTAAVADLFTEDAVYLPPDAPPVTGPDSIAAAFTRDWDQGAELNRLTPSETILAGADWVFENGTWELSVSPPGSETPQTVGGSYLVVVHRTASGWKLARDASTYDAVPPAMGATGQQ